jgi:hypothetical protein
MDTRDSTQKKLTLDKNAIVRELIDIYATRMISPNISFHTEFYKKIQEIQASKTDIDIQRKYTFIKQLKNHNIDYNYMKDIQRYFLPEYIDKDTVMRIVGGVNFSSSAAHQKLQELRDDIQSDEVFQVLNYILNVLLTGGNCMNMGYVTAWLLQQNPKHIFVKGAQSGNDIIDIIFGFCVYIASKMGEDFDTYCMISRDLYYYKASKKHARNHRMGIFYMLIHVLVTRRVDHELKKPMIPDDIKNKYMFVICHKDSEHIHEVYADRVRNHASCVRNPLRKRLTIEDSVVPQRKDVPDIVKM